MNAAVENRIVLGGVTIEWAPEFVVPIGDHPTRAGRHVVLCDVAYHYGQYTLIIPAGFEFDGASIPWCIRWVPGFAKHDWHFLASLPHDFVCEHPEVLPRPIGDGIFVSIMVAIARHRHAEAVGTGEKLSRFAQAWLMYIAVSGYTIYRAGTGSEIQLA